MPPRARGLDDATRDLRRAATLARFGLAAVGAALVLDQVRPMLSDAQFTWGERRVMAIVAAVTLGGFAVAGWALGRVLDAAAGFVAAVGEAAEAASRTNALVESHLMPGLARLADAVERLAGGPDTARTGFAHYRDDPDSDSNPDSDSEDAPSATAEARRAIAGRRWGRADRLLDDLRRDRPGSPEVAEVAAKLATARRAEVDRLGAEVVAATVADDPARAIARRDDLTLHLRGEALRDLDARLARWLAGWVRARVRRGEVTASVAEAAASGAERFGDSADGRALLAAVPDLRRAAGLCPGCARPYRGPADTCPACLAAAATDPRPSRATTGGPTPKGSP